MRKIAFGGKNGKGKFAIVDDEDYELLSKYKWTLHNMGYARTSIGGQELLMHQVVALCLSRSKVVDHIDRDQLNNTRNNLRIVTQSQNMMNQKKLVRKTSTYKGVSYISGKWRKNRWCCQVKINRKRVHCSYHDTEISAAKSYNEVVLGIFGEFSNLNVVV